MNASYIVYCRRYSAKGRARNRPIGKTSRLSRAVAVAAERNAYRRPGEVYGVETAEGLPVWLPPRVECEALVDLHCTGIEEEEVEADA